LIWAVHHCVMITMAPRQIIVDRIRSAAFLK
jgi:hypothetical protein